MHANSTVPSLGYLFDSIGILPPLQILPTSFHTHPPATRLEEDKLEDVVEDEPIGRGVLAELEGLGVAKRALLVIDLSGVLDDLLSLSCASASRISLTTSWPVTRMMIPPLAVGWASGSPYSCLTFWKGRDCLVALSVSPALMFHGFCFGRRKLTISFSVIPWTPRDWAPSKVSIEFSRCVVV